MILAGQVTTDGTVFDTKELDNDNVLARIPEWGFPIFYLAERHRLTTLTIYCFDQAR
uniref:Uncharacterized protein n=1 Tax=Parascaris equorum TaxID=6256 RepID=A0A914R080_PAREQ